ncbi:PREDICTED: uncharacterized protein LOC109115085 [Nelumbo nucifera]|uniref:Uncharacterized protein LOC109115085 n=1 Tax=Nelumbo nucifera TaxID=4432 RepID=A0A1U8Q8C2_NELNU|nr:PREDICTED: uncharacterized protein LOC109115085 [Nelumbo nucifera]
MGGYKPARTPTSSSKIDASSSPPLKDPTTYRSLVGALQYVTLIRPNITFPVNQACQHLQQLTEAHLTTVKRIFQYLKGTISSRLFFKPGPIQLSTYCDADWASCPLDHMSTNGFCVFLGPNPISWCAKKQPIVVCSSTKAEYCCLAHTAVEISWLCSLFKELHIPILSTSVIWCDNTSAIVFASNPVFHARSEHIEVDYHFVREQVTRNFLDVRHIPSNI